ncbi:hypothetical protein BR1R3_05850 [Pseudomonas atacamensis]|nr:hypothetical protein BR1R3_05850 [Pseudomonas atacamensis]
MHGRGGQRQAERQQQGGETADQKAHDRLRGAGPSTLAWLSRKDQHTQKQLWERACSRKRCVSFQ